MLNAQCLEVSTCKRKWIGYKRSVQNGKQPHKIVNIDVEGLIRRESEKEANRLYKHDWLEIASVKQRKKKWSVDNLWLKSMEMVPTLVARENLVLDQTTNPFCKHSLYVALAWAQNIEHCTLKSAKVSTFLWLSLCENNKDWYCKACTQSSKRQIGQCLKVWAHHTSSARAVSNW